MTQESLCFVSLGRSPDLGVFRRQKPLAEHPRAWEGTLARAWETPCTLPTDSRWTTNAFLCQLLSCSGPITPCAAFPREAAQPGDQELALAATPAVQKSSNRAMGADWKGLHWLSGGCPRAWSLSDRVAAATSSVIGRCLCSLASSAVLSVLCLGLGNDA